ncbi:hypothetical protein CXP40_22275, partial [Pseudomonas sp. YY-1]|uniref:recombinase family protein n=1 Tax=Pseudomonas sp. YY-1 TaxID=2058659 RepID=UPI000CAFBCF0
GGSIFHQRQHPEASKAFAHGLPVVVAKLDRLSRDVEHIAGLMKRADFKVATMPGAKTLELHLYAMLAQQEREFISQRTKEALQKLSDRAVAGDAVSQQKVINRAASLAKGRTKASQAKGGGLLSVALNPSQRASAIPWSFVYCVAPKPTRA